MLNFKKINIVFYCICVVFVSPIVIADSSQSEYTELLLAASRQLVNGVNSVEIIAEKRLDYPEAGWSSSRTARVRTEGNMVRTDISADILSKVKDDKSKEIVRRNWSSAFDGKTTTCLTANTPIFTISPGNNVEEYALFYKGMYMYGLPIDKWLESMDITYSGKKEGQGLHKFTGIKNLAPSKDGKPRSRRFEIVASDKLGFAIVSCDIFNEANKLLSEYKAEDFNKIGADLWVPTSTIKNSYIGSGDKLTRKELTKVKYVTLNEPMESTIFRLVPPPNYTIVDRVNDIVINPADLDHQLLDNKYINNDDIIDALKDDILQPDKIAPENQSPDHEITPAQNQREQILQKSSEETRKHNTLSNRNLWLIAIGLLLALFAGIMIGRKR